MSTLKVDTWESADGTYTFGKCYAWVNFNGTGTVAINASLNVASITDNGTGNYTVNFTNALGDTNYAPLQGSLTALVVMSSSTKTTGSFTCAVNTVGGTPIDVAELSLGIFR